MLKTRNISTGSVQHGPFWEDFQTLTRKAVKRFSFKVETKFAAKMCPKSVVTTK